MGAFSRLGFPETQCTSDIAIDPLEYMVRHSNLKHIRLLFREYPTQIDLDGPPNYTHRKKQWHYYFRLQSRHRWHKSSLRMVTRSPVWECSWSANGLTVRRIDMAEGEAYQVEPFLLQTIHDYLKGLVRYLVQLLLLSFCVEHVQPFLIFATNQLLNEQERLGY
jgi:hypothetical protein